VRVWNSTTDKTVPGIGKNHQDKDFCPTRKQKPKSTKKTKRPTGQKPLPENKWWLP